MEEHLHVQREVTLLYLKTGVLEQFYFESEDK